jgi:hypothetical protein
MTASTTAYRATAGSRSGKEDNSCLTRSSEMSSLALLQRARVLEVLALVVLRARPGAAEEYGLFSWGS